MLHRGDDDERKHRYLDEHANDRGTERTETRNDQEVEKQRCDRAYRDRSEICRFATGCNEGDVEWNVQQQKQSLPHQEAEHGSGCHKARSEYQFSNLMRPERYGDRKRQKYRKSRETYPQGQFASYPATSSTDKCGHKGLTEQNSKAVKKDDGALCRTIQSSLLNA